MFDSCRRDIHYLRLSVTDRCNLRCRYCMPDGAKIPEHEEVLTHEEFLRLAALFAQCGIDTVRVTGGEPLVRKSVAQLVAGLKATPGIRHVSMTTNGTLLAQQLPALLDAGLDSVNISLDTLDPAVFRHITARDEFAAVQAACAPHWKVPCRSSSTVCRKWASTRANWKRLQRWPGTMICRCGSLR